MRIGDTFKLKCRKDRPVEAGDIIYVSSTADLSNTDLGTNQYHAEPRFSIPYDQSEYVVLYVHQDHYNVLGYSVIEYSSGSERLVIASNFRSCNCESCDDSISKTNKIKEVK